MAWFTLAANAPTVTVAKREIVRGAYALAAGTAYTQTTEVLEKECRGMTYAAADAYLTTEATAGNNPQMIHIGNGGYNVRTTEVTTGAWTEVV